MLDVDDIADVMASIVAEAVEHATAPLIERIAQLEAREMPTILNGAPGKDGADGRDVDPELVRAMIIEQVAEAVAQIPPAQPGKDGEPGKDGADADPETIARMVAEQVAKAIEVLPPATAGADGIGVAGAVIDRDGGLILTLSNGETRNLGRVVGKDGVPGQDGHTFTLDDFDIEPLDERTIKMGFTYGEVKHSFELAMPAVIYRGVWQENYGYQRGDLVTWGGSMWHCDKDGTLGKPDGGDFTLAVKRGRDGRSAPMAGGNS